MAKLTGLVKATCRLWGTLGPKLTADQRCIVLKNILFRDGNIYLRDGNIYLRDGNIISRDGNIYLRDGNIYLRDGNIYLRDGNIHLRDGNIILRDGNTILRAQNRSNGECFFEVRETFRELPQKLELDRQVARTSRNRSQSIRSTCQRGWFCLAAPCFACRIVFGRINK